MTMKIRAAFRSLRNAAIERGHTFTSWESQYGDEWIHTIRQECDRCFAILMVEKTHEPIGFNVSGTALYPCQQTKGM